MAILKTSIMGHPVLRQKSSSLTKNEILSTEVKMLINDMVETIIEYNGLGLAAPQVHVSKRIVVVDIESCLQHTKNNKTDTQYMVLINPEVTIKSKKTMENWEGCLSVPDIKGKVSRPSELNVKALNVEGEVINFDAEDLLAVAIQHEIDHLDGILFIDKLMDKSLIACDDEYRRFHFED